MALMPGRYAIKTEVQINSEEVPMSPRPDRPVSTIMSWPVVTIDHGASLAQAAEALAADNIGALVVTRDGNLAGVISERDLVAHLGSGSDLDHLLTGEAMADDVVVAEAGDSILTAARMMVDADVRHLPVLGEGLIAGMVSMRDVVAVLAAAVTEEDVVVVPSGTRVVVCQA
jgi:CBS domain-containing protein